MKKILTLIFVILSIAPVMAATVGNYDVSVELDCNRFRENYHAQSMSRAVGQDGNAFCKIDGCIDGYLLNDDENDCVPNPEPTITDEPDDIKINESDVTTEPVSDTQAVPDDIPEPQLSPEDAADKLAQLQKNADDMQAREQSLANRALGAGGMGAVGIGLGELMGGSAQVRADENATQEMQAFVNTFYCDYGGGARVAYGTTDFVLPGANDLFAMYREYIDTADALKITKQELGMMPGIESEIVFDRAASGLYDDESAGRIGGGTYASVSGALLGTDNGEWAAQTDAARNRVRSGAIAAIAGAGLSAIGNAIVNTPGASGENIFGQMVGERSREINAHFDRLRRSSDNLGEQIDSTPILDDAESGEAVDIEGVPPPMMDTPEDTEIVIAQQEVAQEIVVLEQQMPVADQDTINKSLCETIDCVDGKVVLKGVNFDFDEAIIKSEGLTILSKVAQSIIEIQNNPALSHLDMKVVVNGYTDSVGSEAVNAKLSSARALAVKDNLQSAGVTLEIIDSGLGKTNPVDTNTTVAGRANNRRVEIGIIGVDKN